jgi:hypothetical protein
LIFTIASAKASPATEANGARECSRCCSKNVGTYEFCGLCGRPSDEKLIVAQELQEQKLKNEVEVLWKEVQKREGVGEYLDYPQTQIEQL